MKKNPKLEQEALSNIEEARRKPYTSSELCQAKGCEDDGHLYTDMLIPIRLCGKHAKLRRNGGRR